MGALKRVAGLLGLLLNGIVSLVTLCCAIVILLLTVATWLPFGNYVYRISAPWFERLDTALSINHELCLYWLEAIDIDRYTARVQYIKSIYN